MALVNFYRGLREKYSPDTHKDGLFFSTDTLEIILNGSSFGGGLTNVEFSEGKLIFSFANGTTKEVPIDEATQTLPGLLSALDKQKLDNLPTGTEISEDISSLEGKVGTNDYSGTNYLDGETNVTDAVKELDTQLKTSNDSLASINQEAVKEIQLDGIKIDPTGNTVNIPLVSQSADGVMSSEDKAALDALIGDGEGSVQDQIKTALEDYLPLSGGTMTGNITFESTPDSNEHEYVDLGLPSGNLWAKCNIGANTEEEGGLYFQWGDTQGYAAEQVGDGEGLKAFSWADYKFSIDGSNSNFSKYNASDSKTVLDPEDDAAHVLMGGNWRMPTFEEYKELCLNTDIYVVPSEGEEIQGTAQEQDGGIDITWASKAEGTLKGVKFYKKGDKQTYMFVPASGYAGYGSVQGVGQRGNLWASSLNSSEVKRAWVFYFYASGGEVFGTWRCYGYPVRGVLSSNTENSKGIIIEGKTESDLLNAAGSTTTVQSILDQVPEPDLSPLQNAIGANTYEGSNYLTKETNLTDAVIQLDEEIKATNDNLALEHANAEATYAKKTDVPTNVSQLTNDSGYQTEAQVDAKVASLVDSAPETLDTLNELAAALGDDPNFATTVTNKIAAKQDKLVSGTNIKTINGQSLVGTGNINTVGRSNGFGETFNSGTNVATGTNSHAEGDNTNASGNNSHTEGSFTQAKNNYEHAEGHYNLSHQDGTHAGTTRHSVGMGNSDEDRKNAFEIMADGSAYMMDLGGYDGINYASATSVQDVIKGKQDALVSGNTIKTINNQSLLGNGNITIESGASGDYLPLSGGTLTGNVYMVYPNPQLQLIGNDGALWIKDAENNILVGVETWNDHSPVNDKTYGRISCSSSDNSLRGELSPNSLTLTGSGESIHVSSSGIEKNGGNNTTVFTTDGGTASLGNYATTASVSQAVSDATFNNGHNAVSSVAGIPVSKRLVIATISNNGSFTLASTPADGREIHVIVHNTNSSDIEITMPSGSNYVKMSGDTLTVAGNSYADINVISDGTNMYIRAL